MDYLATSLSRLLRTKVDQTSLTGKYDITLDWAPDERIAAKLPSQWDAGEIYQLRNQSPWANQSVWAHMPDAVASSERSFRTVVTWDSALPIRQALKTDPASVYASYYVVGVDGLPPGNYSPRDLAGLATLRSSRRCMPAARKNASSRALSTCLRFLGP